jgi:PAS domain S-box-containing protein
MSQFPHPPANPTTPAPAFAPPAAAPALGELVRAAAAQLAEGVIVADVDGRIVFVNEAAERLHGVARLDVPPEAYAATYQLFTEAGDPYPSHELPLARAVLRGETVVDAPWRIRRPDGTEVHAVGSARPVRAADGRQAGAVLTIRDLTAERAATAALRRLAAELETRNAQLQEQQLELELANQQLHDQAMELETQAEELQTTAAHLAEQTAAADRARSAAERLLAESEAAAAALTDSEARHRLAVDVARLGTWTWDLTTDAATFDARVRELFGFEHDDPWPRVEILATRVHAEDRARVAAALAAAADPAGDGRYEAEYRVVRPDGSERWARAAGRMFFADDGGARRPAYLIGTALDVTEFVQARQEVERARDGMARLFEAERTARTRAERLQALTAALAPALTAREVAARVVGQVHAAVQARTAWVARVSEDGRWLDALGSVGFDAAVIAQYERIPVDAPLPTRDALADGAPHWFRSRAALEEAYPLLAGRTERGQEALVLLPLTAAGRHLGVLSVGWGEARDADDETLAVAQGLAGQCAQALERARLFEAEQRARAEAERLQHVAEGANQAKSQFLATMSHELRTPLNAIQGYVQLLDLGLHGPVSGEQRQTLGRIDRAQHHLLALINDILNFAKLESGRVEYDVRAVRLADVVADVVPVIEPQVAARGLTLQLAVGEAAGGAAGDGAEAPLVWADREKLAQVLLNLLANAVKFTPAGGRVRVEIAERAGGAGQDAAPPDVVFLRVSDTGPGVPADKLRRSSSPSCSCRAGTRARPKGRGWGWRSAATWRAGWAANCAPAAGRAKVRRSPSRFAASPPPTAGRPTGARSTSGARRSAAPTTTAGTTTPRPPATRRTRDRPRDAWGQESRRLRRPALGPLRAGGRRVLRAPRREGEREHRAARVGELDPRAAAERLHRLAHDAEPETGALDARHGLAVRAVELVEQAAAGGRRHPEPVVGDADDELPAPLRRHAEPQLPRDLHPPLRGGRVGVLDRVREVVRQAQLHRGRVHLHRRQVLGDPHGDAARLGRRAELPRRLRGGPREEHVALLARVGVEARQRLQVVEHLLEPFGVLGDHALEAPALCVVEPRLREQPRGPADGADAVLELVRHHPVEAAQALLAFAHPLAREAEEVRQRRLADELRGVRDALPAGGDLARPDAGRQGVELLVEEREQDRAQDLVLLEDLVGVEPLGVPERAELHRLGGDGRLGVDVLARPLEVVGDPVDEERHVVQQLVGREDAIRRHGDPGDDPVEPAAHERVARLAEPAGQARGEVRRLGGVHGRQLGEADSECQRPPPARPAGILRRTHRSARRRPPVGFRLVGRAPRPCPPDVLACRPRSRPTSNRSPRCSPPAMPPRPPTSWRRSSARAR